MTNIIDLTQHTKEILFSSLSSEEQRDYLICCDEEAKLQLNKDDATIPKPIEIILGTGICNKHEWEEGRAWCSNLDISRNQAVTIYRCINCGKFK